MYKDFIRFVRDYFQTDQPIPLHAPSFSNLEKEYLLQTIESTYVSSVGPMVNEFEAGIAEYTGAGFAIATVNGTSALHVALRLAGVGEGDEVITQSLTFVGTVNAIRYCGGVHDGPPDVQYQGLRGIPCLVHCLTGDSWFHSLASY